MDDWPRTQLQQLAPTVDEAASKRMFDERRAGLGEPERWRFLAAAAAIVIIGVGSLALIGLVDRDGEPNVAQPDPSGSTAFAALDDPAFEVIHRGGGRTSARTLSAAVTSDQLIGLLGDNAGAASSVDFRRQIVVAIPVPRDVCNARLTGFDADGRTLTPNFEASSDGCPATTAPLPEPRFTETWFVAIDRAGLSPSFTLRLPPEPATGDDEMLLDVQVPPADSVPEQPAFEVLDVQDMGDRTGTLRSAVDGTQLEVLWSDAGLDGEVPDVDFRRHVVISATIYGSGSCVDEFDGFDVSDQNVWTPRFAPLDANQVCTDDAVPRTYVVAVDREVATPEFTLRLLDSPLDEPRGERRLRVEVPPLSDQLPPPPPSSPTDSPGTDPDPAPPPDTFEVLAVQPGTDMGVLRSAVDTTELARLWADGGLKGEIPDVDFDRWIVVSIAIPDDACPPTLSEFTLMDSGIWTPLFVETAQECEQPLIPKTYVVAIDRASVSPRFTLRLPGDPVFFEVKEQRLEVEVRPSGDPAPVTEPTGANVDGPEWVVPLPDRGEAESLQADDGTPLWIVHHEDGTVSALPAITPNTNTLGTKTLAVDQRGVIVRWRPDARRFEAGVLAFDEYGRSLTTGRDDDLAVYTAEVRGDTVVVRPSGLDRVPGTPAPASAPSSEPAVDPALPEVKPLPAVLSAGWSQIDATLVSHRGTWKICDVDRSAPVPELATCPNDALVATGLEGGHDEGYTNWYFGPLVMHVDRSGAIDVIVTTGGYASSVDE